MNELCFNELIKLAEKVAKLNPDAGEIGDGMLHQLVDQAIYALGQKDLNEKKMIAKNIKYRDYKITITWPGRNINENPINYEIFYKNGDIPILGQGMAVLCEKI